MGSKYVNQSGTSCSRRDRRRVRIVTLVDVPKPPKKRAKIIVGGRPCLIVRVNKEEK